MHHCCEGLDIREEFFAVFRFVVPKLKYCGEKRYAPLPLVGWN